MTRLAEWLRVHMEAKGFSQAELCRRAGVSEGTLSATLTKGHIPKIEAVIRLAEALGGDGLEALYAAEIFRRGDEMPRLVPPGWEEPLTQVLVREFQKIPPIYREDVVEQIRVFARALARREAEVGVDVEAVQEAAV
jgi:transcriptional regulator with XRE-family HTH domain